MDIFLMRRQYHYLKKYPLDIIQITLDGQKERHNHLRSLKKSLKPMFDIIVSNIKKYC